MLKNVITSVIKLLCQNIREWQKKIFTPWTPFSLTWVTQSRDGKMYERANIVCVKKIKSRVKISAKFNAVFLESE